MKRASVPSAVQRIGHANMKRQTANQRCLLSFKQKPNEEFHKTLLLSHLLIKRDLVGGPSSNDRNAA